MQMVMDGVELNFEDEDQFVSGCEKIAANRTALLDKAERAAELQRVSTLSVYLAAKLGGLAAVVEAGHTRMDIGLLYELADFAGMIHDQRFGFVRRENERRLRVELAAALPSNDSTIDTTQELHS